MTGVGIWAKKSSRDHSRRDSSQAANSQQAHEDAVFAEQIRAEGRGVKRITAALGLEAGVDDQAIYAEVGSPPSDLQIHRWSR